MKHRHRIDRRPKAEREAAYLKYLTERNTVRREEIQALRDKMDRVVQEYCRDMREIKRLKAKSTQKTS